MFNNIIKVKEKVLPINAKCFVMNGYRFFFSNLSYLSSSGVLSAGRGNAERPDRRGRLLGGTEAATLQFPFLVFLRVTKVAALVSLALSYLLFPILFE